VLHGQISHQNRALRAEGTFPDGES